MNRFSFLFAAAALTIAGCSSVSVQRDYDASHDFSTLRTFAWQHAEQAKTGNPRIDNDLIDQRVRAAVNKELRAKGLELVEAGDADILVAYFIDYQQRLRGGSWSVGMGGGRYGRYGGVGYNSSIEDYEEGALTIDMINPSSDKMVWRGIGRRRAFLSTDPDRVTKVVNDAVTRILKPFPPRAQ